MRLCLTKDVRLVEQGRPMYRLYDALDNRTAKREERTDCEAISAVSA